MKLHRFSLFMSYSGDVKTFSNKYLPLSISSYCRADVEADDSKGGHEATPMCKLNATKVKYLPKVDQPKEAVTISSLMMKLTVVAETSSRTSRHTSMATHRGRIQ